jgi:hypothetical protein
MDKELVDVKTGELAEGVPIGPQVMVFGTTDLDGITGRATQIAVRLKDIVEKATLYSMIKQKKYVKVDGWTAMAAMLGVFPEAEYCRKLDREDEIAYESRVLLRHISGNLIGAGEAICSSKEGNWAGRDEFTIKSMAQTRATGKACRLSFSWIMAMAGYSPTPAEEMMNDGDATKVAMPRAKEVPQTGQGGVNGPGVDRVGALAAPDKKIHGSGPRVLTDEETAALKPPESKFFAQLHATVRKKGVSDGRMKAVMMDLFRKESSKDLTDAECATLIKAVESGKV